MEEVKSLPDKIIPKKDPQRRNLCDKPFVTIDGSSAKDFDDAICVEQLQDGFRLYVAIADVSHYVPKGSYLDKEALKRANSVYFPDTVIPMLPEKLSEDLCSLRPNEYRLTLNVEIDFDFKGFLKSYKVYQAYIKSMARLTYQQIDDSVKEFSMLKHAKKLAHLLISRHLANQALDLNIPEHSIKMDSEGMPIALVKEERLFSHKMIEQFMLAANQVTAYFLQKNNKTLIYRIHEPPDKEKLKNLEGFAKSLGYHNNLKNRQSFVKLLKKFKNHPKESHVSKLVLRSLSQARYSAFNKKHYGLNFKSYTHFTSPIRRYCDLMIHRLIKDVLLSKNKIHLSKKEMESQCLEISEREQASVKAEREIMDIKKAHFLYPYLGKEFEGVISSVIDFGLFVNIDEFDIEGLIPFHQMQGYWVVDKSQMEVRNRKTSYRMKYGDRVCIQLTRVDKLSGQVDFKLVSHTKK